MVKCKGCEKILPQLMSDQGHTECGDCAADVDVAALEAWAERSMGCWSPEANDVYADGFKAGAAWALATDDE